LHSIVSMLQRITLGVVFYVVVISAPAQVISINTYRHHGKKVEIPSLGLSGFAFHKFDTTLTDTARLYLDVFAQHYRDSLFSDRQYMIDLTCSMTETEKNHDDSLGYKRLKVVIHYLDKNYGMGVQNFRGRFQVTVTHICTGTVGKERRSKGRRGMHKQGF
jgi:hypothetical protein